MDDVLARNWGLVALRGMLALLFGIVLIALAFRLRSWQHGHGTGPVPHAV